MNEFIYLESKYKMQKMPYNTGNICMVSLLNDQDGFETCISTVMNSYFYKNEFVYV